MADPVPEEVKHDRLLRLQRVLERQQTAFNANCLGKSFEVLFERRGRYPGQIVGRSPYLQAVQDPGEDTPVPIGGEPAVPFAPFGPTSPFGRSAPARPHAPAPQPDTTPAVS